MPKSDLQESRKTDQEHDINKTGPDTSIHHRKQQKMEDMHAKIKSNTKNARSILETLGTLGETTKARYN